MSVDCSVVDYTALSNCLYEKIICDFYNLLNLKLKRPCASICDLYEQVVCCDPNIKLRLCKLSTSLMSFSGCNKDDYLFWRLVTLYSRTVDCKKLKPVKNAFCIADPCIDWKTVSTISQILSSDQLLPDCKITGDTMREMAITLFKTYGSTAISKLPDLEQLLYIAAYGCKMTCDPFVETVFPDSCASCSAMTFNVYTLPDLGSGVPFLPKIPRLSVFGFLIFLIIQYLCKPDYLSCLCVTDIVTTIVEGDPVYSLCSTALTPVGSGCPVPANVALFALSPLADAIVTLVKKLYCAFNESVCDCPCPDSLFTYLLNYSPEYNNMIKQLICLKPCIVKEIEKSPCLFDQF